MNQQNITHKVLGIMSGTSLDGLDLCCVEFHQLTQQWEFRILQAETLTYPIEWKERLQHAEHLSGAELIELDFQYGKYLGLQATQFLLKNDLQVDFIASHGHTVFHQIEKGFTYQLGHGAAIAAESRKRTVSDFRSLDVALGGQGAPLVPFGDMELFSQYDCCINLGGIANLSFQKGNDRVAFDICAFNMVLNHLMRSHLNKEFDKNGETSRTGRLDPNLFAQLNQISFYKTRGPKSLGKEIVYQTIIPLLESSLLSVQDQLHTFLKHAVFQIGEVLRANEIHSNVLLTGGGSKNAFALELLQEEKIEVILPTEEIIDFKEALIFAFLGLKRVLNEENTLKSVTGSLKNSCGGNIFLP